MKTRPARKMRSLAMKLLPVSVYLRLALVVYPLLSPTRRWPHCTVRKEGPGLYHLQTQSGDDFYFYELRRLDRYLWPDSIKHIEDEMLDKYQDGPVQIDPGDVVIDVGANIGEFARAASRIAGRVIAVEPDPVAFKCLKRNHPESHKLAFAEQSGSMDFYISSKEADSSLIKPKRYVNVISVQTKTLDSFVEENGIEQVDFLKIEAEGAEPEVLAGAENVLRKTRKVAADCGPERRGEPTRDAVFERLTRFGFTIHERGNMLYGYHSE